MADSKTKLSGHLTKLRIAIAVIVLGLACSQKKVVSEGETADAPADAAVEAEGGEGGDDVDTATDVATTTEEIAPGSSTDAPIGEEPGAATTASSGGETLELDDSSGSEAPPDTPATSPLVSDTMEPEPAETNSSDFGSVASTLSDDSTSEPASPKKKKSKAKKSGAKAAAVAKAAPSEPKKKSKKKKESGGSDVSLNAMNQISDGLPEQQAPVSSDPMAMPAAPSETIAQNEVPPPPPPAPPTDMAAPPTDLNAPPADMNAPPPVDAAQPPPPPPPPAPVDAQAPAPAPPADAEAGTDMLPVWIGGLIVLAVVVGLLVRRGRQNFKKDSERTQV